MVLKRSASSDLAHPLGRAGGRDNFNVAINNLASDKDQGRKYVATFSKSVAT